MRGLVQLISIMRRVIYSGGRQGKRAVLATGEGLRKCGGMCVEEVVGAGTGLGACSGRRGDALEEVSRMLVLVLVWIGSERSECFLRGAVECKKKRAQVKKARSSNLVGGGQAGVSDAESSRLRGCLTDERRGRGEAAGGAVGDG